MPQALLVSMTMVIPYPSDVDSGNDQFLQHTKQAQVVQGLSAEMEEEPVRLSFRQSLASSMNVKENDVRFDSSGIRPQADRTMQLLIKAKVTTMALSVDGYLDLRQRFCPFAPEKPSIAEMRRFLQSWRSSLQRKATLPERQGLGTVLENAQTQVASVTCSKTEPPSFDLGATLRSGVTSVFDWVPSVSEWLHHHSRVLFFLALLLLLLLLIWAAMVYGPRGYQKLTGPDQRTFRRTLAQRFESRSARIERVKSRVEKYAGRTFEMVMAAEPDYEDTELQYYVKVLNRCKGHAKVLCGSPWGPFHTPGDCELCKRRIDCAEKGCQCAQGGHRLCWNCMVTIINWESLSSQEGQHSWTWSIKDWL